MLRVPATRLRSDKQVFQILFRVVLLLLTLAVGGCGAGTGGSSKLDPPAKALSSLQIAPLNPVLFVRGTVQHFTVTGTFTDGSTQDMTTSVSWSVSNASVVSVTAGAANALTRGRSKLTASSGSVSASTTIIVLDYYSAFTSRFMYAANANDDTLSMYTVSDVTGALRHNGYVLTGAMPVSVAVDPSEGFVVVANQASDNVSSYKVGADGTLSSAMNSPVAAGSNPASVIIEPSGSFVYVANSGSSNISGFTVDRTTGALAPMAGSPFAVGSAPRAIIADLLAHFLYVANSGSGSVSVLAIDAATGALTPIAGSPFATMPQVSDPAALAMDPAGKTLFVCGPNSSAVAGYAISSTGALSFPATFTYTLAPDSYASSVAVSFSGELLFVANAGTANVLALRINRSSGSLTPPWGSPFATGESPVALAVAGSGGWTGDGILYVANAGANSQTVTAYSIHSDEVSYGIPALTLAETVGTRGQARALALSKGPEPILYTPLYAYAMNNVSHDLAGYAVNASTGALTPIDGSPFAVPAGSHALSLDPTGKVLYVGSGTSIPVFSIAANTGAPMPITGSPFPSGGNVGALSMDVSSRFLYAINLNSNILGYTIDSVTGAPTMPAVVGFASDEPTDLTVEPSGRFVATLSQNTNTISLFTQDPRTGVLTFDRSYSVGTALSGAPAFHPRGRFLYAADAGSQSVFAFAINPNTNQLEAVPGSPFGAGAQPSRVTVEPSGHFAYVTNGSGSDVSGYRIDPATGALTALPDSPFTAAAPAVGVAIDPSGRFLYTSSGTPDNVITGFAINLGTGALTRLPGPASAAGNGPVEIGISGNVASNQ